MFGFTLPPEMQAEKERAHTFAEKIMRPVARKYDETGEWATDVYKTAFEIDQRWVVELAADRAPEICQSQSVNIFLPGDVDKWDLHMLHWLAWERGVKSLYYLRSKSVQRAAFAGGDMATESAARAAEARTDYDECLACQ